MGKNLKINRGIINLPVKIAFFFFYFLLLIFKEIKEEIQSLGKKKKVVVLRVSHHHMTLWEFWNKVLDMGSCSKNHKSHRNLWTHIGVYVVIAEFFPTPNQR